MYTFQICREECEVQLLVSKVQPKYSPVPGEQAETSSCALHGKMGGCKEHTKKPHHNNRWCNWWVQSEESVGANCKVQPPVWRSLQHAKVWVPWLVANILALQALPWHFPPSSCLAMGQFANQLQRITTIAPGWRCYGGKTPCSSYTGKWQQPWRWKL